MIIPAVHRIKRLREGEPPPMESIFSRSGVGVFIGFLSVHRKKSARIVKDILNFSVLLFTGPGNKD